MAVTDAVDVVCSKKNSTEEQDGKDCEKIVLMAQIL